MKVDDNKKLKSFEEVIAKKKETIKKESKPKIEEHKSIKDKVEHMYDVIESIGQPKKNVSGKDYRFKWNIRTQFKNLSKKGKILLFIIRANNTIESKIVKVEDGFFYIDKSPRVFTHYHVNYMNGKVPVVILPEWNTEPIGNKDYFDKFNERMSQSQLDKFFIGVAESNEVFAKKSISRAAWIGLGLAAIAGLYVLFGGSMGGG